MTKGQLPFGLLDIDTSCFWPLKSEKQTIGREYSCEISSASEGLSRQHAQISMGSDGYLIEDLNSLNGVLVNGQKVERQSLKIGDQISCGQARWLFCKQPELRPSNVKVQQRSSILSLTQCQPLNQENMGLLNRLQSLGEVLMGSSGGQVEKSWLKCVAELLRCDRVFHLRFEGDVIVESAHGETPSQWPKELLGHLALGHAYHSEDVVIVPVMGPTQHDFLVAMNSVSAFEEDDVVLLQAAAFQASSWIFKGHDVNQLNANSQGMLGESQIINDLFKQITRVAPSEAHIWIRGESGTGKELLAQQLHQLSKRKDKPLVAVNCGAIPASIADAELFGQVKGAFTGAVRDRPGYFVQADGGTLFLDEILELTPECQVKLLRVIQEGQVTPVGGEELKNVNVRVLCASHGDPQQAVKDGRFREDLFHRLHVIELQLPPLREREGDIDLLAQQFLKDYNRNYGRNLSFSVEATALINSYTWPGNIRELRNVVERAVLLANDDYKIQVGDLQLEVDHHKNQAAQSLKACEDEQIIKVLEECGGRRAEAARRLGIARSTLYERLRRMKK